MRLTHRGARSGRSVREKRLENQPLEADYSFLEYCDMLDLFQSHLSLHFNRLYEEYRLTGIPIRFLVRLVFLNDAHDQIEALSQLSPSNSVLYTSCQFTNFHISSFRPSFVATNTTQRHATIGSITIAPPTAQLS